MCTESLHLWKYQMCIAAPSAHFTLHYTCILICKMCILWVRKPHNSEWVRGTDISISLKLMHSLWSFLDCHRSGLPRWPCRRGGSCCLVTTPHEQADFPLAPFPKSGFLQKQGIYLTVRICTHSLSIWTKQSLSSYFKLKQVRKILWLIAIYKSFSNHTINLFLPSTDPTMTAPSSYTMQIFWPSAFQLMLLTTDLLRLLIISSYHAPSERAKTNNYKSQIYHKATCFLVWWQ